MLNIRIALINLDTHIRSKLPTQRPGMMVPRITCRLEPPTRGTQLPRRRTTALHYYTSRVPASARAGTGASMSRVGWDSTEEAFEDLRFLPLRLGIGRCLQDNSLTVPSPITGM